MNVKEFYGVIGGDYEDMKRKFLSDARIGRFALMFLRDGSMDDLRAAIRSVFFRKGEKVVEDNLKAFDCGYESVQ